MHSASPDFQYPLLLVAFTCPQQTADKCNFQQRFPAWQLPSKEEPRAELAVEVPFLCVRYSTPPSVSKSLSSLRAAAHLPVCQSGPVMLLPAPTDDPAPSSKPLVSQLSGRARTGVCPGSVWSPCLYTGGAGHKADESRT